MTRRFLPVTLLCAVAVSMSAQQSTTIQTETRVVLVDAIVTAKNGAYVRDLTQKDFHISEDNKDQTIRSFAFESSAETSQPRSLVLFLDQSSIPMSDQRGSQWFKRLRQAFNIQSRLIRQIDVEDPRQNQGDCREKRIKGCCHHIHLLQNLSLIHI